MFGNNSIIDLYLVQSRYFFVAKKGAIFVNILILELVSNLAIN